MPKTEFMIQERHGFRFVDEGPSSELPPVVLLHGMLGDLSNWTETIGFLAGRDYRVLVPVLPVYELPIKQTSVNGLADYVCEFLRVMNFGQVALAGNSLGGQVALLFALNYPEHVAALVLSGSSGIYEAEMGSSTPRRRDKDFIRERAALTFFDPVHATDDLVDEMFRIINNRAQVARLIKMARSTKEETVRYRLSDIDVPTLLIWGSNDLITPPEVAEEFRQQIPQSELHFISECGHAPMMEQPDRFNRIMLNFLREHIGTESLAM